MSSPAKDKPRLTEQEKKNNHIASEQKRRQAIREGFDRLANLVPGMEGQGRSESLVLNATIEYMKAQIAEHRQIIAQMKAAGIDTADLEIPNLDPPSEDSTDGSHLGGIGLIENHFQRLSLSASPRLRRTRNVEDIIRHNTLPGEQDETNETNETPTSSNDPIEQFRFWSSFLGRYCPSPQEAYHRSLAEHTRGLREKLLEQRAAAAAQIVRNKGVRTSRTTLNQGESSRTPRPTLNQEESSNKRRATSPAERGQESSNKSRRQRSPEHRLAPSLPRYQTSAEARMIHSGQVIGTCDIGGITHEVRKLIEPRGWSALTSRQQPHPPQIALGSATQSVESPSKGNHNESPRPILGTCNIGGVSHEVVKVGGLADATETSTLPRELDPLYIAREKLISAAARYDTERERWLRLQGATTSKQSTASSPSKAVPRKPSRPLQPSPSPPPLNNGPVSGTWTLPPCNRKSNR